MRMIEYILVESCDADIGIYKYPSEEAAKESLFNFYATVLRPNVDDEKVAHALSLLRSGEGVLIEENWQPCGMPTDGMPTFTADLFPDHGYVYDADNGVLIAWRLEPLDALTK